MSGLGNTKNMDFRLKELKSNNIYLRNKIYPNAAKPHKMGCICLFTNKSLLNLVNSKIFEKIRTGRNSEC